MYITYDPKKHKGLPLLEMKTLEREGVFNTVYESVPDEDRAVADIAPQFYVVEVPDA